MGSGGGGGRGVVVAGVVGGVGGGGGGVGTKRQKNEIKRTKNQKCWVGCFGWRCGGVRAGRAGGCVGRLGGAGA